MEKYSNFSQAKFYSKYIVLLRLYQSNMTRKHQIKLETAACFDA